MAKKGRVNIEMRSTGIKANGEKSTHWYNTTKNPKTLTEKLKMKKYDPMTGKHEEYVEGKIRK